LEIDDKDETELKADLDKFLVYYNLNRRHGSLKRELKVRTPFEAVECWYRMNPSAESLYQWQRKGSI
jgi:hypothetical protein